MDKASTKDKVSREIAALKKLSELKIDTSEIRVLPHEKWANAVVGEYYRPIKKPNHIT